MVRKFEPVVQTIIIYEQVGGLGPGVFWVELSCDKNYVLWGSI